jgi:hypothetical protein
VTAVVVEGEAVIDAGHDSNSNSNSRNRSSAGRRAACSTEFAKHATCFVVVNHAQHILVL